MIELERYELREGPAWRFVADRRDFLRTLGGGLCVILLLDSQAGAQESGRHRRGGSTGGMPQEIGAWMGITRNGAITVYTGKTEVGQNIRTSLTQAVAEELRCPPASITLAMADTDVTPYDMGTFGSRTTPYMAPQLRKVAAAAREMLLDLAAAKWQADRAALRIDNGRVVNPATSASAGFGELTEGKELVKTIAESAPLTPAPAWQIAGHSLEKVDGRAIVTGSHKYTSDMKRPGMLYGRVLRPSCYGAKLVSVDTSKAGAKVIREGDFVGVVCPDEHAASKALAAIQAEWKSEPQPSSKALFSYLKANAKTTATPNAKVDEALQAARHKVEASYTVAYIAHTPLEPRAAVAEWNGPKLTVWTGSQVPFGVRSELAEAFAIPENQVRVIVPDTGSGYGGKHTGECAIEAARLAKGAGKPVKVVWTREEEFTWAYFRPAGVIDIRAGVTAEGKLAAWEYHNYNSGPSGIEPPYEIGAKQVQFHETKSPLRQGSYRGLAATANHFARESHMDDLARAAGQDPLAFRLRNLSNPRMKAVLEAAAERFGWGKSKTRPDQGFGIACGFEKNGYVACCAEVSATPGGKVKLVRVVESFECGAIVNPKHLENQVQGAVVMAIGGALFESIEFEQGRLLNGKLSRYRVPRFSDVPAIETVLVNRQDLPSAGAGETPIVGLAPAVGNAIFMATGERRRSLPMLPPQVA